MNVKIRKKLVKDFMPFVVLKGFFICSYNYLRFSLLCNEAMTGMST
jgi:hypothetical protein